MSHYRGRLAPSPTGYLHLGHARTFWVAHARARAEGGVLVYRDDDLDFARCRPEYSQAGLEDLRWLGLDWDEGPDCGGSLAPYNQAARLPLYREALGRLHAQGLIFRCDRSRKDVLGALAAPHEGGGGGEEEPLYPTLFRPPPGSPPAALEDPVRCNWRFRVPDGRPLEFTDRVCGPQRAVCGQDFGDFLVWRKDGVPSYQLACAVDDLRMGITEVVRGADLIRSTFRQILLIEALGGRVPAYLHCPLLCDAQGRRLAKRSDALALRQLRSEGVSGSELRARCAESLPGLCLPA